MGSLPNRPPEEDRPPWAPGFRTAGSKAPGFRAAGSKAPIIPLLLGALFLVSCLLKQPEEEVFFDLEADPVLIGYSRVTILLEDSLGNVQATLFDDTLRSVQELRHLPAGPYRGGAARIVILGRKDGKTIYRETRVYDGASQSVASVDIYFGPLGPDGEGPALPGGNPPFLAAAMPDTVVSIRDSVAFWARAADPDGDLAGYSMDCDGDGTHEFTAVLSGPKADIFRGRRFADSGSHACGLKIWDKGGRTAHARLAARVELDPPVADAGVDTVVEAGGTIVLHARGTDRFGPIVTREWKIGTSPFRTYQQQETTLAAPGAPGVLVCILRVTDSDALNDEDTLVISVIPRTSLP